MLRMVCFKTYVYPPRLIMQQPYRLSAVINAMSSLRLVGTSPSIDDDLNFIGSFSKNSLKAWIER